MKNLKNIFKKLKLPLNKQGLAVIFAGLGLLVVVTYGAYKFQQLVSPSELQTVNGVTYGLKTSDRNQDNEPLKNNFTDATLPDFNKQISDGPTKLNAISGGFEMARIQGVIYYYER